MFYGERKHETVRRFLFSFSEPVRMRYLRIPLYENLPIDNLSKIERREMSFESAENYVLGNVFAASTCAEFHANATVKMENLFFSLICTFF